jgi:hypothetical protein
VAALLVAVVAVVGRHCALGVQLQRRRYEVAVVAVLANTPSANSVGQALARAMTDCAN